MYHKLESLRGIAACLVFLFHSPLKVSSSGVSFIANSYLFVDMFFLLSGFVISFAYSAKIRAGMRFKNFIILRLARLYPLHLFMLLVFLAYLLIKVELYKLGFGGEQEFERNNLYSFLTNLLLIHSLGLHDHLTWNFPSWSISVELYTYVVFYVCFRTVDREEGLVFPLLVVLMAYLLLTSLEKDDMNITVDFGFVRCLGAFYLGVALQRILRSIKRPIRNVQVWEVVSVGSVVACVSLAHLGWYIQLLSIVSFAAGLAVFVQPDSGFLGKILGIPLLRSIGLWSYSIYMTHEFILTFTESVFRYVLEVDLASVHGLRAVFMNLLLLAITVCLSRFTYEYIENRVRNRIKVALSSGRDA